jgi:APA family basic amino acid/polyamine antiporter
MVFSGTFDQLTDLLIFASFIFYGSTAVALLCMRLKSPNIQRSYKVIWYPLTPILFILSCLLLIGVTLFNQPKEALSGLGLIAAGIPFYYFWNRKQ